jgi:acetyltransferase
MSIRNFDKLMRPRSVAVIGASTVPGKVGTFVLRNMVDAGFAGRIFPVNPKYAAVGALQAYPRIDRLPEVPDLAVIATPPAIVPEVVRDLGARGTRAAVVLTAGLGARKQAMLDAAKPHCLRLLGPNCLGLILPGLGLDASFAHRRALPGGLAFISQSGALCTAVLDWATSRGIGFSVFASLGDSADIDVGDMLDWLASDAATKAVLLYLEDVRQARKFMSAARAAARNKPVIVVKSGRAPEGARAAASHTGALAGADEVYDAAFRRAGMLRVVTTEELFDAVETLAYVKPVKGDRLGILTNGGGPGVMAADALVLGGGRLAALDPSTIAALDAVLPETWSRANPVDIIGDASGARYRASIGHLLADPGVDAALVMHAPTATASAVEAAGATVEAAGASTKNVFAVWLGADGVADARRRFAGGGVPNYATPDQAVTAFLRTVEYRRNQASLIETPASQPEDFKPDVGKARAIVAGALAKGRAMLDETESKDVLAAFGIPVVATAVARDAEEASRHARSIGYPVALKILSPDITHKTEVGGVALDLAGETALREAASAMIERARHLRPDARLGGFSVQAMIDRPGAHEIILGLASDRVFGPVVLFGQGGVAVEVVADKAVGLPPLNMNLAGEIVARTRVAKLLRGYRNRPPADDAAIRQAICRVGQIAIDLPEVEELDINPLLADAKGVIALDARIKIRPIERAVPPAIRPYPRELEERIRLFDGREALIRPIRPEDEPTHREFFARLSREDLRLRFFGVPRDLSKSEFARFTQIDYDREMALIATAPDADGKPETLGVVRTIADPDNIVAEFAIIVRSDLKRQGLGRKLLETIIAYQTRRGTSEIRGEVLAENVGMLDLVGALGFSRKTEAGDVVLVRKALR